MFAINPCCFINVYCFTIYQALSDSIEYIFWFSYHFSYIQKHTATITSVDWSDQSNAIVTCGHDRNAYVYCWVCLILSDPIMVVLEYQYNYFCLSKRPIITSIPSWFFFSISSVKKRSFGNQNSLFFELIEQQHVWNGPQKVCLLVSFTSYVQEFLILHEIMRVVGNCI